MHALSRSLLLFLGELVIITECSAQASLITNGSFETPVLKSPAQYQTIPPGAEPPGFGWHVTSGNVDVVPQGSFGIFNNAFDGTQFLDMDGTVPGTISQTFGTTPGSGYILIFAYANNFGLGGTNPAKATVNIVDGSSGANLIAPLSLTHGSSTSSNLNWTQSGSIQFIARGTTTSLSFASNDPGGSNGGIFLDGVSVTLNPNSVSPAIALSVAPASGSGTTQAFTFSFADTTGFRSLSVVDVLINNVLDGRHACYIAFIPNGASSGTVLLVDDAGEAGGPFQSLSIPGGGAVSNGQCSVTGAGSTVSASGTNLVLTLPITFSAAFGGNRVVYAAAQETTNNSGWQTLGTWGVPGPAAVGPAVVGMIPAHSSAPSNTYTFTFTDTNGWQDIAVADVLVNNSLDGRRACYLALVPSGPTSGTVFLVDDTGDAGGPFQAVTLPGSGTTSNGQCAISGAGGSVNGNGNTLTVILTITFNPSFAGNWLFYLAARSNSLNSNWQTVGTLSLASVVYDLSSDWSNSSNPNGPWSYNQGSTPLPFVPNFNFANTGWASSCNQPAWAPSNATGGFLPAFLEVNACVTTTENTQYPSANVAAGDVWVHTVDGFNGNPSLGAANVLFTLPASGGAGVYTISGSLWDSLASSPTSSSRPQDWSLFVNGVQVAAGVLSGNVLRSQAQTFSVVNNLNVGDQVKLQIVKDPAAPAGFIVSMNLTITKK